MPTSGNATPTLLVRILRFVMSNEHSTKGCAGASLQVLNHHLLGFWDNGDSGRFVGVYGGVEHVLHIFTSSMWRSVAPLPRLDIASDFSGDELKFGGR